MIAGEIAHHRVKIRAALERIHDSDTMKKQAQREVDWRSAEIRRLESKLHLTNGE